MADQRSGFPPSPFLSRRERGVRGVRRERKGEEPFVEKERSRKHEEKKRGQRVLRPKTGRSSLKTRREGRESFSWKGVRGGIWSGVVGVVSGPARGAFIILHQSDAPREVRGGWRGVRRGGARGFVHKGSLVHRSNRQIVERWSGRPGSWSLRDPLRSSMSSARSSSRAVL